MVSAINSAISSLLGVNTGTNALLGINTKSEDNFGLGDVLQAAYGTKAQSADVVDLSDGLKKFIEENVTDENQKAKLLASLEAINDLSAMNVKSDDNAVSTLLGGNKNNLLNLFA